MALPVYLAMTAAEFRSAEALPEHAAWMACHFSCYGTGLSNLPEQLPAGAMVILNDRTPVFGHDPELIAKQLSEIVACSNSGGVLLDFQRPDCPQTANIVKSIVTALSCPVAVTEAYAEELDCPIFLSPPPLCKPLAEHIIPWKDREIWLEVALDSQTITVTPDGSHFSPSFPADPQEPSFPEDALFCRYHTDVFEDQAVFTLFRTREMLDTLLQEAERLGVCRAVGLYQELGNK